MKKQLELVKKDLQSICHRFRDGCAAKPSTLASSASDLSVGRQQCGWLDQLVLWLFGPWYTQHTPGWSAAYRTAYLSEIITSFKHTGT